MTQQEFVRKNLALSADFSEYLLSDPDLLRRVPDRALVVFRTSGDQEFNRRNLRIAKRTKKRYVIASKEHGQWAVYAPSAQQ